MSPRNAGHGPLLDRAQSDMVSAAVRSLRREQGLGQADVAAAAGLSQRGVSELERLRYCWRRGDAERAAELLGTDLPGLLEAGAGAARGPGRLTPEEAARAGRRIAALRRQRGWKQRALAEKAGVAQSTVSVAEHGEGLTSRAAITVIAGALGVTLEALLGDCGWCHGTPPEGFTCNTCGEQGVAA